MNMQWDKLHDIYSPQSQRCNSHSDDFYMQKLPLYGKRYQIYLSPGLADALERKAIKEKITIEELIARMLEKGIKEGGVL